MQVYRYKEKIDVEKIERKEIRKKKKDKEDPPSF